LNRSHLAQELPSKHVIKGKIERRMEVTGRGQKRHKQLLGDFKENKRC